MDGATLDIFEIGMMIHIRPTYMIGVQMNPGLKKWHCPTFVMRAFAMMIGL
jgi:hypothetical protein